MSFVYLFNGIASHVILQSAFNLVKSMDSARVRVFKLSKLLKAGLKKKGYIVLADAYIVAIVLGSNDKVLSMQALLRNKGINVAAVRHPTVAKNQECIRFSVRADHSEADINQLLEYV